MVTTLPVATFDVTQARSVLCRSCNRMIAKTDGHVLLIQHERMAVLATEATIICSRYIGIFNGESTFCNTINLVSVDNQTSLI